MKLAPALSRVTLSGALLLASLPVAGSALAAQADVDLLYSYVGDWRGRGLAVYRDNGNEESMLCRMSITEAANSKVRFNGSCSLAGGGVRISGTVGYSDANSRYEARATAASYEGIAIGRRQGGGIAFTMTQSNPDDGSILEIELGLALNDSEISVDFGVMNPEDGWGLDADVPMERQ